MTSATRSDCDSPESLADEIKNLDNCKNNEAGILIDATLTGTLNLTLPTPATFATTPHIKGTSEIIASYNATTSALLTNLSLYILGQLLTIVRERDEPNDS